MTKSYVVTIFNTKGKVVSCFNAIGDLLCVSPNIRFNHMIYFTEVEKKKRRTKSTAGKKVKANE